ncbi:peptidase inhibitor family I36 protein [Streptomyces sp. 3N207]|uniref:peptidase inhibitor family I36 protein n=1 Tax=Streptomyces sp. 3N207 TaxID=3457417 RepID=UPI003FCFD136
MFKLLFSCSKTVQHQVNKTGRNSIPADELRTTRPETRSIREEPGVHYMRFTKRMTDAITPRQEKRERTLAGKLPRAMVTAGLAGLLSIGLTAGAQASNSPDSPSSAVARAKASCPAEHVCFYPDTDYRGTPINVDPWNMPTCGATPLVAASVYNHTRDVYTFYPKSDCGGRGATLNPDTGALNFSEIGESRVASWR